ncbi:MAG TPA: 50S ribosomal protein L4 [bacterium]
METILLNVQGEEIGRQKLSGKIFEQPVKKTLLWENIKNLLNNQRRGTAKTKTRAEIRGGGKKPWRQKGIGWARHGSIRSPIWRKGGVVFGPKPRDYYVKLPQKKRLGALIISLSAKAGENRVVIIEDIKLDQPKTKTVYNLLKTAKLDEKKLLIGVDSLSSNLKLATRNIPKINLRRIIDVNAYDVMSADYVLLTKKALENLELRCSTKKS